MVELDDRFLIDTYFGRCDDCGRGRNTDPFHAGTTLAAEGNCWLRPLVVRDEVILNGQVFGDYLETPCVELNSLLKVCFKIFEGTCRKPDMSLRVRHVLTSIGYLLLRLADAGVLVVQRGKAVCDEDLTPMEIWEALCATIWGAAKILHDGDTLQTWMRRIGDYQEPL